MTEVFIDTSAIYATLVVDDQAHPLARTALTKLGKEGAVLVTHSFVIQECVALLQARSGLDAVQRFHDEVLPALRIVWVTDSLYQRSMAALLAASSRRVSLTDWMSFVVMQDLGIQRAFAFDRHFSIRGFKLVQEE